jgi:cytochrome c oxidase subunit II
VRRGSIVQLVILGMLFAAGAAAVALFIPWLPRPASEQADRIDFVFWFVTAICIAIFALVAAVITYSLLHFRAGPDDDSDGPPTHGHTGLEIWWTAVPAVLVTAISIVSAIVLAKNEHLPHVGAANATANAATSAQAAKGNPLKPLVVKVTGQQFAWLFQYPGFGNATSSTLRLPLDVPVQLRLGSLDVIHSFWVPEFGQKQDAVPGLITKLVITPNRLGTFPVICTELCGLGHAVMRSQATVLTRGKFLVWAKAQGSEANPGNGAPGGTSGKKVFVANGCNGCHTFKPAQASGTVGPDLDKLEALARTAGKPLDEFIRQSIVDPGAYIESGFPNAMPGTYSTLPPEQIDALVKFLSGGGS